MTTQLFSVAEAGKRLNKHPKTILRMIHTGELAATTNGKRGTGARYHVPAKAVEKWIRDHEYHPEI